MDDRVPPRKYVKLSDAAYLLNERDFETALWDLEESLPEELITGRIPSTNATSSLSRDVRIAAHPAVPYTVDNSNKPLLLGDVSASHTPHATAIKWELHPIQRPEQRSESVLVFPQSSAVPCEVTSSQLDNSSYSQDFAARGQKRPYPSTSTVPGSMHIPSSSHPTTSGVKVLNCYQINPVLADVINKPNVQCSQFAAQNQLGSCNVTPTDTFAVGIRQRLDRAKKFIPRSSFVKILDQIRDGVIGSNSRISPDNRTFPLLKTLINQVTSTAMRNVPEEIDLTGDISEIPRVSAAMPPSSTIASSSSHPTVTPAYITGMHQPATTRFELSVIPSVSVIQAVSGDLSSQSRGLQDPTARNSFPCSSATTGLMADLAHEKRKLIRQQLKLLLHSYRCRTVASMKCAIPHCRLMKDVLQHIPNCKLGKGCTKPHCSSSRQIINHWRKCPERRCQICYSLLEYSDVKFDSLNLFPQSDVTAPTTEKPVTKDIQEGRTCIVCMEHEITHAIVPCGHTLCANCGDALQKAGPVCHVCRGPFEKLFRIYLQ